MKSANLENKSTRQTDSTSLQGSSVGKEAISIAPPEYGIDFVDSGIPNAIQKRRNKTGLPHKLKAGIENLSGMSMDDVRVHYNSTKPALLQALAYTQGTEIHVAPGQERHLPHEAWHVVQQKQERVKPTLQSEGFSINADKELEREADKMGVKALKNSSTFHEIDGITSKSRAAVTQAASGQLLHSSDEGRDIVQFTTSLGFDTKLTGKNKITSTQHVRGGVHSVARKWVLANGGWSAVPSGEVCNHSRGYDSMAQDILEKIHDEKLYKAAEIVKGIYEDLKGNAMGIGKAVKKHEENLQDTIDDNCMAVDRDDIVDSFNYYIYKICDYPRNLFFWPSKTDGDPDEPYGLYGTSVSWKVSNAIISDKKRLKVEKGRLEKGRKDLDDALA